MPKAVDDDVGQEQPILDEEQGEADQQHFLQEKMQARGIVAEGIGCTGHGDGDHQERLEQKADIALQERNGDV